MLPILHLVLVTLSAELLEGWPMNVDKDTSSMHQEGSPNASSRCMLARREWRKQCLSGLDRPMIPTFPAPTGSRACPNNCSEIGSCNLMNGLCDCPVGLKGSDCSLADVRPCTNRPRGQGSEPATHVDVNGRDLNWGVKGWMIGRCPGICDQHSNGACYCDGPMGHIPAPPGSPPWVPAIRRGRPIGDHCKPKNDGEGQSVEWRGGVEFNDLYGPGGWCSESPRPRLDCKCSVDGWGGTYCNTSYENVCLNQCSMRDLSLLPSGDCFQGFCRCFEGYFGPDCAQMRDGIDASSLNQETELKMKDRPWVKRVVSLSPEMKAFQNQARQRRRPLIYIYDLPQYTSKLLQNRVTKQECFYRKFNERNETEEGVGVYLLESYLHELLLQSRHRTFDPDKADFFYVPVYICCLMYPVWGFSDTFWYSKGPHFLRPLQASAMLLEAKQHILHTYPYWNRSNGRDHVWLANHDEGACWFPTEIYQNSIILTHWGRMGDNHSSGSQYGLDNYSHFLEDDVWLKGRDWRSIHRGHPCYTPGKDFVLPSFKWPSHYAKSPLLGGLGPENPHRFIKLFFKGDVGRFREGLAYSRGIRQRLANFSKQGWREKHSIWIGDDTEPFAHSELSSLSYSELLARSVFCLVVPGDGWSSRAEDAMMHGCIPFIVMDHVHTVYESILSWQNFSIRIKESQIDQVPEILSSISGERIKAMHSIVKRLWMRFVWRKGKVVRSAIINLDHKGQRNQKHYEQDAFSTLMLWLYTKSQESRPGKES